MPCLAAVVTDLSLLHRKITTHFFLRAPRYVSVSTSTKATNTANFSIAYPPPQKLIPIHLITIQEPSYANC